MAHRTLGSLDIAIRLSVMASASLALLAAADMVGARGAPQAALHAAR
jgi:hypothetical protein